jgi:hypothetical protein
LECEPVLPAAVGGRPRLEQRCALLHSAPLQRVTRGFSHDGCTCTRSRILKCKVLGTSVGTIVLTLLFGLCVVLEKGVQESANFTEQSPGGVNSHSVTQEIHLRVLRRDQRNPPLAPHMSQMDAVHTLSLCLCMIRFNIILPSPFKD